MTDIQPFKAHGKVYNSEEEANARIKEINELIFQIGVSDGRLTEWLDIEDGLAEAVQKAKDREKREEEYKRLQWKAEQIRETERELASLKIQLGGEREYGGDGYQHRITWFDANGHRRVSRYTTTTGFLKAYLRMIKADVAVWDAV